MHLVTIGIPTYRRPDRLRRAVASALAQDHAELEVVISDNASGDETGQVCRELTAADARVRVITQAANVGPTRNFIAVRDAARGEYFMWLADDDWLDPDYVSACLGMLAGSPGVAVVGGRARYYRDGAVTDESKPMNLVDANPSRRVVDYFRTVEENTIFHGLMRRETIGACTFRNTLAGDWLVMAQVACLGEVWTNPRVVVHRERAEHMSATLEQLVKTLQLPRTQAVAPAAAVAIAAAHDVLALDDVFGRLGRIERAALASAVGAIVIARIGIWRRLTAIATPILGVERGRRWKAAVIRALARR